MERRGSLIKISGELLAPNYLLQLRDIFESDNLKKEDYREVKELLISLAKKASRGIEYDRVQQIASEIAMVPRSENTGIVIGAGNLWRGALNPDFDRNEADNIGMLATVMNANALKVVLNEMGKKAVVLTASEMPQFGEYYTTTSMNRAFSEGNIVIFSGGTGNAWCSTDTAAAIRALNMNADRLIKLTNVDGVYNKDPKKYPDAKKYQVITYEDALTNPNIRIMDDGALSLCQENKLPIIVIGTDDNYYDFRSAIIGWIQKIGTFIADVEKTLTYEEVEKKSLSMIYRRYDKPCE